jgi:hypothetical protein
MYQPCNEGVADVERRSARACTHIAMSPQSLHERSLIRALALLLQPAGNTDFFKLATFAIAP